jgi:TPR repeat protein
MIITTILGIALAMPAKCQGQSTGISAREAQARAEAAGREFKVQDMVCWLRVGAEKGNPQSMFQLGNQLVNGAGVQKNMEEGARWLKEAGRRGNVYAMKMLVNFYSMPAWKHVNPELAKGWQAASQGRGPAPE